jgi:hypothetical protein
MSLIADLIELNECGTKEKRKALAKKIKSKKKDKPDQLEVDNTAYAGKSDGWTAQKE